MTIDTYALCSVTDVALHGGLDETTDRDLLETVINGVSAMIELYCDRYILTREYTEYQDEQGVFR